MNIRANNENKRFGRDLMNSAEARNGLPMTNYGGRKGMSSAIQADSKVINFDLFRQERRSGSLCIADQKAAHDLIVHSIASLKCTQQGAEPGRTALAFSALRNLAKTIKTNFGTETEEAGGTHDIFDVDLNHPRCQHAIPLQGLGQGNGQASASYTIVTALAYNMLSKQGYIATFTMSTCGKKVSFYGTVFVDDDDGVITANFDDSMEEISERSHKVLVAKEAEMRSLGQTFQLDEMGCYLISFYFDKAKPFYLPAEPELAFTIKYAQGNIKMVKMIDPHTAQEVLVIRISPGGNNTEQIKVLQLKASEWATRSRQNHLPISGSIRYYTTTIKKLMV